jgi:hypothetical protein
MFDQILNWFRGDKGGKVYGAEMVSDPALLGALESLSERNGRPVRVLSADGSHASISMERFTSSQVAEAAGRSDLFPGVTYYEQGGVTQVDMSGETRRTMVGLDGIEMPWHSNNILRLSRRDES